MWPVQFHKNIKFSIILFAYSLLRQGGQLLGWSLSSIGYRGVNISLPQPAPNNYSTQDPNPAIFISCNMQNIKSFLTGGGKVTTIQEVFYRGLEHYFCDPRNDLSFFFKAQSITLRCRLKSMANHLINAFSIWSKSSGLCEQFWRFQLYQYLDVVYKKAQNASIYWFSIFSQPASPINDLFRGLSQCHPFTKRKMFMLTICEAFISIRPLKKNFFLKCQHMVREHCFQPCNSLSQECCNKQGNAAARQKPFR